MNYKARVITDPKRDSKGFWMTVLKFDRKVPRKGELVDVRWGSKRSSQQNSLYWVYLNFLIDDCDLKDQGHFDPQALHLNLKNHFLAKKIMDKGQFRAIEEATTTILNKVEFGEYLEKIDNFVREFFEVDTQPFWDTYMRDYKI